MKNKKYNGEFKTIDTPEKAYVLGLYYADGFVSSNKTKKTYFSGIKLHKKDTHIIEDIVKAFPFFRIRYEKSVTILRGHFRLLVEDLIYNGVLPNKSSLNKKKLRFPKLDSLLVSHFIRGYFDGDGSVFFSKTASVNTKGLTLTSNNYFFIKRLVEILYYNAITGKLVSYLPPSSYIGERLVIWKSKVWVYIITNRKNITSFSNYIYANSNLHFKRKYIIATTWTDIVKLKCPRCGGSNTRKHGVYCGKQKIECLNCNKISTEGKTYYKKSQHLSKCKHCASKDTVHNGIQYSRTTGKVISLRFKCKNCNRGTNRKIAHSIRNNREYIG